MLDAAQALRNFKSNAVGHWNRGTDSATRSDDADDAANRILDGYADIRFNYRGPRFPPKAPVFTMGSCFAREIERALRMRGGKVVSVDGRIDRPEFHDALGRVRSGVLHRFTPASMALEFRWPLDEQPGWHDDALIFDNADGTAVDVNYKGLCADRSAAAVRTRRRVAGELVREVARARVVVVTLGLAEGWVHLPSGLPVNAIDLRLLKREPELFALQQIDVMAALASLEEMLAAITRAHRDGRFQMFVTVSPVPFLATFTDDDVVVANARSKATLRAAAGLFADAHEQVHYFPSYELVTYSDPELAWRPDRVHVERPMVTHVVDRFVEAVFASEAA